MIKSLTLLGSSSGRNAGDAALIAGIMDSVDQACGRGLLYEIPTIKPSFIRENYQNRTRPVGMLPWNASIKMLGVPTYQSIMRTDLTLVFDAILFDRSLYNPLFNYLSTLALMLPRARRAGKRLGFFNVSAGPVATSAGRKMLANVARTMDFITVRDQNSYNLLREIGVTDHPIIITADAALTMRSAPEARVQEILSKHGFKPSDEILGVNVSKYLDTWAGGDRESMGKEKFLASYSAALNRVLKDIGAPVLFVSTQHHDIALTQELMNRVTVPVHKAHVTNREYSPYEIRGVLGALSLLCGMRLHATILASSGLAPIIALPHQPKVSHYFKTLELQDYVLTFDNYSEDALAKHYLRGWSERSAIRRALEKNIPISRAKALQAARLVAALADGKDITQALTAIQAEKIAA
jgi:polysaccharide pyruvyl transferase WcaK-like protein